MRVSKAAYKGVRVLLEIRSAAGQKRLESSIKKAVEKTVPFFRKKGSFSFSVALVGTAAMRALSRTWKGKDKATDVLSFGFSEKEHDGFSIPNQAEPMGEIVICVPYAKKQAQELGISLAENMATLASHGTIHLFGLDHERSQEEYDTTMKIQQEVVKGKR